MMGPQKARRDGDVIPNKSGKRANVVVCFHQSVVFNQKKCCYVSTMLVLVCPFIFNQFQSIGRNIALEIDFALKFSFE